MKITCINLVNKSTQVKLIDSHVSLYDSRCIVILNLLISDDKSKCYESDAYALNPLLRLI